MSSAQLKEYSYSFEMEKCLNSFTLHLMNILWGANASPDFFLAASRHVPHIIPPKQSSPATCSRDFQKKRVRTRWEFIFNRCWTRFIAKPRLNATINRFLPRANAISIQTASRRVRKFILAASRRDCNKSGSKRGKNRVFTASECS